LNHPTVFYNESDPTKTLECLVQEVWVTRSSSASGLYKIANGVRILKDALRKKKHFQGIK
jgi:hypothetical protein